jgi:hypothetical protein
LGSFTVFQTSIPATAAYYIFFQIITKNVSFCVPEIRGAQVGGGQLWRDLVPGQMIVQIPAARGSKVRTINLVQSFAHRGQAKDIKFIMQKSFHLGIENYCKDIKIVNSSQFHSRF